MKRDNLIISTDNPLYGKLGHIWKKYNYSNIIVNLDKGLKPYLYIPPEMVINEYITMKSNITKTSGGYIGKYYNYILNEVCGLDQQEYFDIMILHINNYADRPRCPVCGKKIKWSKHFKQGYGGGGDWIDKIHVYCCASHKAHYQQTHQDEYEPMGLQTPELLRDQFLNLGNPDDEAYFYIASTEDGLFKYGATCDLDTRFDYSPPHPYKKIKILFKSTRYNVGWFEYQIKCQIYYQIFKTKEYLDWNNVYLFRKYFRILQSYLDRIDQPIDKL